jgi:hypothetical protein
MMQYGQASPLWLQREKLNYSKAPWWMRVGVGGEESARSGCRYGVLDDINGSILMAITNHPHTRNHIPTAYLDPSSSTAF